MRTRTWIMACTLAAATSWHAAAQQDMVVPLKDERNRQLAMENAVVRVWEVIVPVGEWGQFHEHNKDTVSVRLNTTTVVNEPKGGYSTWFATSLSKPGACRL